MKITLLIGCLALALLVTACAPAQAAPTPDTALIQTSAAQTVIANFTLTASAPTFTPLPAITQTAPPALPLQSATPATPGTLVVESPTLLPGGVTATQGLCDHYTWNPATLDVNVPDGTQMTPGQKFVKTWKIKNDGICTWGGGYRVVYAGYTNTLNGQPQPLNGVIGPGQEVEISVQFTAPTQVGEYVSAWTMANAAGTAFFGPGAKPIYVKIVVKL